MRKFKIIFFFLICLTCIFACHDRLKTVKHTEFQGSSIFEQKCSNCHEADECAMLLINEKFWENTLLRMSKKRGAEITRSDIEKLVSMHVEKQKAERDFFLKQCTHCHGAGVSLPDIKTKREWKETIRRMMAKTKTEISDKQMNLLIGHHERCQTMIMAKCFQCHDLERVLNLERDEETWRKIVTAMSKEKGSDINKDEINIIVGYHRQRQKKDRELFETKCSKCHKRMSMQSLPEVEKTSDQWKATIRRMMEKTNEVMSNENVDTLIHYHIRAHSLVTLGKLNIEAKMFGLDSVELFERKCSTCHSLEKSLHILEESWQKTIQSMAKKEGSAMTESDVSKLVNFHVTRQKKEQELFLRDCSQCHPADVALETGKTDEQWRQTAIKMMDKAGRKISKDELDILTQYHIKYEKTMTGIAMEKCSKCHDKERTFTPMGTAESWEQIIVAMSEKEGSGMTFDDVKGLVNYHVAKQKIEQQVFQKDCSECHEPEETLKEKKSKDEWKQTIRRMMSKTDKMITDEELDILIHYHMRRVR